MRFSMLGLGAVALGLALGAGDARAQDSGTANRRGGDAPATRPAGDAQPGAAPKGATAEAKPLVDDERVRVRDVVVPAGERAALRADASAMIFAYSAAELRLALPAGGVEVVSVLANHWAPANAGSIENVGGAPAHLLLIEVKGVPRDAAAATVEPSTTVAASQRRSDHIVLTTRSFKEYLRVLDTAATDPSFSRYGFFAFGDDGRGTWTFVAAQSEAEARAALEPEVRGRASVLDVRGYSQRQREALRDGESERGAKAGQQAVPPAPSARRAKPARPPGIGADGGEEERPGGQRFIVPPNGDSGGVQPPGAITPSGNR